MIEETQRLSKKITFRITQVEYDKFKILFKEAELNHSKYTISDFMRNAIFSNNPKFDIVKRKTIIRDRVCSDESLKIYHLSRIGNNLNQISYHLNKGELDDKLLEKLDSINELLKALI